MPGSLVGDITSNRSDSAVQKTKEIQRPLPGSANLTKGTRMLSGKGIKWDSLRPYATGLFLAILVVAVKSIYPRLGVQPFLLATLPFIIVALYGHWRAAIFTLCLTLVLILYVHLPPSYSLQNVTDNMVEIIVFVIQGIIIIGLLQRLRDLTTKLNNTNEYLEEKVTERTRKLERTAKNLRLHRAKLQELNKSKDEFILISSHELRTPATGVKQYLGMVIEGYAGKLRKKQTDMLRTAYMQNEKQIKIVDTIIDIASLDGGNIKLKRTPADLGSVMNGVVEAYRPKVKAKKQKIEFPAQPKVPIRIDTKLITAAVGNIIENAINFTPEGKNIYIQLYPKKLNVAVNIQDEGVGIAKSDQHKIFNKFSRINNPMSVAAGGTGLGLYWTKKIIEMHGGEISVSSKVGKGSTFTVTLPLETTVKSQSRTLGKK